MESSDKGQASICVKKNHEVREEREGANRKSKLPRLDALLALGGI